MTTILLQNTNWLRNVTHLFASYQGVGYYKMANPLVSGDAMKTCEIDLPINEVQARCLGWCELKRELAKVKRELADAKKQRRRLMTKHRPRRRSVGFHTTPLKELGFD